MNTLSNLKDLHQCLKYLSKESLDEIKDLLTITSENDLHDLMYSNIDSLIDADNSDYVPLDDLESYGYFHDSSLVEMIQDNTEKLDRALYKMCEARISLDTLKKLMNSEKLTCEELSYIQEVLKGGL